MALESSISDAFKNILIQELVCQQVILSNNEQLKFIHNLFSVADLLSINNPRLTSFFLRQPALCQAFSSEDIDRLVSSSPNLSSCVSLYPHIYRSKLGVSQYPEEPSVNIDDLSLAARSDSDDDLNEQIRKIIRSDLSALIDVRDNPHVLMNIYFCIHNASFRHS